MTGAGNSSTCACLYARLGKLIFLPLLLISIAAFPAFSAPLSEQDKACLTCHSANGLQKKLADGDQLSLKIDGGTFAESVHSGMGCIACHATIDTKIHPGAGRKIDSARNFSLAQTNVCKSCHEDKFKQYEGSIHASLLRDGNPIAPVCTDCHAPHAVKPKAARLAIKEIPCQKCHGSIFDAYASSVHGVSRSKSDKSTAPI